MFNFSAPVIGGVAAFTAIFMMSSMRDLSIATSSDTVRPLLAFRSVEHGADRVEVRAEEPRVDVLQARVAVGAVDERRVLHVQRERVAADLDREVGRVGFAVGLELVERAAERAVRRERARRCP